MCRPFSAPGKGGVRPTVGFLWWPTLHLRDPESEWLLQRGLACPVACPPCCILAPVSGSPPKIPQTRWLTTQIYSLSDLVARSPRQRCHRVLIPLKAGGESPFPASSCFWWPQVSIDCGGLYPPPCLYLYLPFPSFSVRLSFISYKDIYHWIEKSGGKSEMILSGGP